jgi:hypothetical protein
MHLEEGSMKVRFALIAAALFAVTGSHNGEITQSIQRELQP